MNIYEFIARLPETFTLRELKQKGLDIEAISLLKEKNIILPSINLGVDMYIVNPKLLSET